MTVSGQFGRFLEATRLYYGLLPPPYRLAWFLIMIGRFAILGA
jgi:hypothetical protein